MRIEAILRDRMQGAQIAKRPASERSRAFAVLAEWTGLEPATPGVTGRYSNQLNYHSKLQDFSYCQSNWRPHGDSNPGYRRERAVS